MTMQAGFLGNCKKEQPREKDPLNAPNTREKIGNRNWEQRTIHQCGCGATLESRSVSTDIARARQIFFLGK
jgi:hypothetical protein